MRTLVTLFVLTALAVPAAAQHAALISPDVAAVVAHAQADRRERQRAGERQRGGEHEQTERTTRVLKLGSNGELHLANIAGQITVARGSGSDVTVEIIKTARGRDEADAREMLQLVEVDIVERASRAEVRARYPTGDAERRGNRRNINVTVDYNVTAPAGVRLRAHSISGTVVARDIKGELSVESVSGDVRIFNGARVASAKSISGSIEVNDTQTDGALNASTASGNVVLKRVKARTLEVGSVSGDVLLEEVDCGRLEAQSISGNVKFSGPLARGGRYELTSHSGTVTVALGGGAGFEVEATSFSGSIRSDFAFDTGQDENGRGRWRRSVRGVHGDGSAVLDLTTFSGSIVIGKR